MYRLLIVDDEPYTVDGLYDLFQDVDGMELELYKAYSAFEALECLDKIRIDIVLTDIEMPEINGLELQRRIALSWPRCKVIFLTGYHHFHYVQTSIRYGAVDYVLKTEDDGLIIEAVKKAYAQLTDELNLERTVTKARQQIVRARPSMQKDYLLDLMQGGSSTGDSRKRQFAELDIPLAPDEPIVLLRARVDRWKEGISSADKALFLYSIHNIVDEYLSVSLVSVHLIYDRDGQLWLLQPNPRPGVQSGSGEQAAWSDVLRFVYGTLESIQASCRQYLKLPVSFAVSSEPCEWDNVPDKFDMLNFVFMRGLGMGEEMLLTDRHIYEEDADAGLTRHYRRNIHLLEQHLERGNKEEFRELLVETMGVAEEHSTVQTAAALEVFYTIASMFISYLNRSGMMKTIGQSVNIGKLFSVESHASWEETTRAFKHLAELCLEKASSEQNEQTSEVVRRIHEYVDAHLDGDLSLVRLAELVHLTPSYLSRLHRETTHQGITVYITDKRLAKAKQLLTESHMKIHEIGVQVGYESPPYFNRFFKKLMNMTPQEYRDKFNKP